MPVSPPRAGCLSRWANGVLSLGGRPHLRGCTHETRANGTGPGRQDPARRGKFGWSETLSMSGGRGGEGGKDGLRVYANIWAGEHCELVEDAVDVSGCVRRRPGPWPICFHHPAQWGEMTREPNAGHWTDWALAPIPGSSRRRAGQTGKLESAQSLLRLLLRRSRASSLVLPAHPQSDGAYDGVPGHRETY